MFRARLSGLDAGRRAKCAPTSNRVPESSARGRRVRARAHEPGRCIARSHPVAPTAKRQAARRCHDAPATEPSPSAAINAREPLARHAAGRPCRSGCRVSPRDAALPGRTPAVTSTARGPASWHFHWVPVHSDWGRTVRPPGDQSAWLRSWLRRSGGRHRRRLDGPSRHDRQLVDHRTIGGPTRPSDPLWMVEGLGSGSAAACDGRRRCIRRRCGSSCRLCRSALGGEGAAPKGPGGRKRVQRGRLSATVRSLSQGCFAVGGACVSRSTELVRSWDGG